MTGAPAKLDRHIVPSILSADFANLARDVQIVQQAGAQSIQVDVMDGHFVPNLTVGPDVVKALRRASSIFLDLHLMIENPLDYIDAFAKAGADLITLHVEACEDPQHAIARIHGLGKKAGLAIRPKTPVTALWPYLDDLDMALVMTVEPGFGGQAFMPEMLPKVEALRARLGWNAPRCRLQVDGGINVKTAPLAAAAGADSLVAGSAVFGAPDVPRAFQELQKLIDLPVEPRVK
jgi:ribulose-phosphate 3-epimerase